MSTTLYSSPIFGPVHSRRLGVSLGINLMPADGKMCTFDCIYCECGRNAEHRPSSRRPTRKEVFDTLYECLERMKTEGPEPNVLTFAGNGEPTAHPEFPEIMDDVISLRDRFFPNAKVSVLSNATRITDRKVFEALLKADNNIQKLDTVDIDFIRVLDCPKGNYSLEDTIEALKAFNGHVIIQTMFLRGLCEGKDMDNTSDRFVSPWLDALAQIRPSKVMIYTIDRETPEKGLEKSLPETLDSIAEKVRERGIDVSVSY
ncbi:MAG: radical SAM protein [Bacteroidaceae bacterium]|nr:radical SAM protein [Bacteroidaceae bacterium]